MSIINVESTTVPSSSTSITQPEEEKTDLNLTKGDSNSAVRVEGNSSSLDFDWETDPANPRNWSIGKKWVATSIVNFIIPFIFSFDRVYRFF